MSFVAADWSIDRDTGNIRYIGDAHGGASPSYATVIEFHRALQDFADDAVSSGNDELDITDETPSDRSTDNIIDLLNGFNIDDTAAEHLYDGSISQTESATIYSGLVVVGSVVSGTQLQIVQNNALLSNYWGTGLNEDATANILLRIMVKVRDDNVDIDGTALRIQARELSDSYAEFSIGSMGLGNNTAAIFTSSDLNNQTAAGTIATYDQFSNTEGFNLIDVTGDGTDEEYYSQWAIGGGSTPASPTINDLYEYTKWIQRRGTAETIHGMNGALFRGITHSFAYDNQTGTAPSTNDNFAWGTRVQYDTETGGPFVVGEAIHEDTPTPAWRGRILALDDDGTAGYLVVDVESGTVTIGDNFTGQTSGAGANVTATPTVVSGGGVVTVLAHDGSVDLYVQLVKGTAPANDTVLYLGTEQTSSVQVNGTVTARTISASFIGASTGSAIIGAYGIGIATDDLTASDQLFDLTNTLRVPPNNVTFTVNGLVSSEDRVLVGPLGYSFSYDNEASGPFQVGETLTFTSPAGTARLVQLRDNGTTGLMVITEPLTGSVPTDNSTISGGTSLATADVNGTVDSNINYGQLLLNTALVADNITAVVATTAIPSDTPSSGTIRVEDDAGLFRRLDYSSYTGSTFTITTTDGNEDFATTNASANNNIFISYLDKLASSSSESFTVVYSSNRSLFIRVRDGGSTPIRTFETTGTIGSAGGSTTAIRTSDA